MSGFLLSGVGLCSMTLVPYGNKSLIHSMEGGRVCARGVDKYASLWWRDVRKVCDDESVDRWFQKMREWKISDGHLTRFWEDSWFEEDKLASTFPRLYNNFLQQGECIWLMGSWSMEEWEWVFNWGRGWFVWENQLVDQLMSKLQRCNLMQGERDCWYWSYNNSGSFFVRSAYAALHDMRFGTEEDDLLSKVWDLEILPKAKFMI
ncbi:hypothetical protein HKD37_04G010393 [Glycine soja]